MDMLPASTTDVSRQDLDPANVLFKLLVELRLKYPPVAACHFRRHTFTLTVERGRATGLMVLKDDAVEVIEG